MAGAHNRSRRMQSHVQRHEEWSRVLGAQPGHPKNTPITKGGSEWAGLGAAGIDTGHTGRGWAARASCATTRKQDLTVTAKVFEAQRAGE